MRIEEQYSATRLQTPDIPFNSLAVRAALDWLHVTRRSRNKKEEK